MNVFYSYRKNLQMVFILICILGLTHCKKGQDHYNVPDGFKKWTVFQKNSYWIYKNEVTGSTDSTYVSKDPELWYEGGLSDEPLKDRITVYCNGSFLVHLTSEAEKDDFGSLIIQDSYSGNNALSTDLLAHPQYYSGNGHTYGVLEVLSTMTLNSNAYLNVYHTRYSEILTGGDSVVKDYYLARTIGLIKFRKRMGTTDTTWSLLHYHAIQ